MNGSSTIGQLKGMMRKHFKQKKKMKGGLVMELIFPVYMGGLLYYIVSAYHGKDTTPELLAIGTKIIPFFVIMYTPYITVISTRFIVKIMVEDKVNKMRETLKLMSLSNLSYSMSIFFTQSIMALFSGIVIGAIMWGQQDIWFGVENK